MACQESVGKVVEYWGCEFLGEDHFPHTLVVRPTKIEHEKERDYLMISMSVLSLMVNNAYLKEIAIRDSAQIKNLTKDIEKNGILKPGTIVYDKMNVNLQDGNHRYIAARNLNLSEFPVVLQRVERIKTGKRIESIFLVLVNEAFDG